jgi:outer membrane protein OmpA-like peptidoglycan-associated protein
MKYTAIIPILLFSVFLTKPVFSQNAVKVDTTLSAETLIKEKFLQGGLELKNITYKGNVNAIGLFNCSSDSFPLSNGIILSTGRASKSAGPNNNFGLSGDNNTAGDADLDRICRGRTFDAAIIEFDFTPSSENLAFDFIFASEEYPEFVNTPFNDVFAFIISRTDTAERFNIAYLPKTFEPITVNNVNHLKNEKYFIDNPAAGEYYFINGSLTMATPQSFGMDKRGEKLKKANEGKKISTQCKTGLCRIIQYDGFTTMITTKKKVIPGKSYHFKIAIADVQDKIYDSGVILRAHSFKSYDQNGHIKGDTSGYVVMDEDLKKPEPIKPLVTLTPEKRTSYRFGPLLFDFDKANLNEAVSAELDSVAYELIEHPKLNLHLYAHTDSYGSNAYNKSLSLRRGKAVKEKLEKSGVPSSQIQMEYFGEAKPKTLNDSEFNRSLNRRVDLQIE